MTQMFTAAQAAQKNQLVQLSTNRGFTAAQAAQKCGCLSRNSELMFTAAQAAQKQRVVTPRLDDAVHCRTGSSETR